MSVIVRKTPDDFDKHEDEIENTGRKWKIHPSETFLVRRGNIISYNPITREFGDFNDLTEEITAH